MLLDCKFHYQRLVKSRTIGHMAVFQTLCIAHKGWKSVWLCKTNFHMLCPSYVQNFQMPNIYVMTEVFKYLILIIHYF